jgi:predicted dehydrogenase
MKEEFRWGIIGTGGIAHAFAQDLQNLPDHRVAAIGSRSFATAQKFANEFHSCQAYGSYEDLTADSTIDGIYVATPHVSHMANTLLALEAGKPVLCEKPFALNTQEAQRMIDNARSRKLMLMEAMWTRFLPHFHNIRKILASGVLGQIIAVEADHGQLLASRKIPRLMLPELGGGALLDLGVYPVSFAHLVLGVPSKIMATASFTAEGVDGQTSAIFDYSSGAQAILTANMLAITPCRAVISGTEGRLEIDRTFYKPAAMRVTLNNESVIEYPNTYIGYGLREEAAEFALCAQRGLLESPLLTHADTFQIMQSMDEIRRQIKLTYPNEK